MSICCPPAGPGELADKPILITAWGDVDAAGGRTARMRVRPLGTMGHWSVVATLLNQSRSRACSWSPCIIDRRNMLRGNMFRTDGKLGNHCRRLSAFLAVLSGPCAGH
jgi:hypothetical protein